MARKKRTSILYSMAGTLYVVSTPIGNLEDLSPRAKEALARAGVVACEDTRVTGNLLRRFGIRTPSVSYHEHNEVERTRELLARLEEGGDVALVSDAGTPLVSDPGYRLVRAARQAGIPIRAIPGASAVLAAIAVSGLPTSRFTFIGFLPAKGASRAKAIEALAPYDHTLVLFESGTRLARLLDELSKALGPREATVLREMTKLHEEHQSGSLPELALWASSRTLKGELTIVIGEAAPPTKEPVSVSSLAPRFRELRSEGLSARAAAKQLGKEAGLSSRDIYNELAGLEKGP
jgi:16S rRNA (cytidine1402-2'-O)-methyltransferase